MFDLEEINLMPSKVPDKPQTKGEDAHARAKAIECGAKWKCTRTKSWVNLDDCVARYAMAKGDTSGSYQPCLECSSIALHLRNMGKGIPAPKFEPKPLPEPKKAIPVSRPAKKGTPDPIQQEAKPKPTPEVVTMPKPVKKEVPAPEARLEIVPPKPAKAPSVDAFTAGFEVYSAKMSRKALRVSYAKLSPRAIHFSASAVNEFGLKGYQTVDAFYKPGVLRFVFRSDNLGEFTPTKRMADRTELKICATGFVKLWRIPEAAFGKKLSIVEHGPGLLEVGLDLGSQKR